MPFITLFYTSLRIITFASKWRTLFALIAITVHKGFMRLRLRRISIGQLKGRYPLTLPTYLSGRLPDALFTYVMRYLILRPASRLDAFSGYPIRTWLPSFCPGQDNWFTSGSSIPVLSY